MVPHKCSLYFSFFLLLLCPCCCLLAPFFWLLLLLASLFVLLALPLGSFFISSSRAIRYIQHDTAREPSSKQPALSRMCSPTRSTDGPCVTLGSSFCSFLSLSLSLIGHYKPSPPSYPTVSVTVPTHIGQMYCLTSIYFRFFSQHDK